MKKLYIAALAFTLILFSCNKDFLDVKPLDKYSDAGVFNDAALTEAFVNNLYTRIHHGFKLVMLSSITDESMDVWQWETQAIVQSLINDSYLGMFDPDFMTSYSAFDWGNIYKSIRYCNIGIERLQDTEIEAKERDRLLGEIHFLRAWFYHHLVGFYGGVPIIDKSLSPGDDMDLERNSYEDCINFILSDCDMAASLLSSVDDKARASEGAALSLKSRVTLWAASDLFHSSAEWSNGYSKPELIGYVGANRQQLWQQAKDAALAVIELGEFSLNNPNPANQEEAIENLQNMFLNYGTNEGIFYTYRDYITFNDPDINSSAWEHLDPGKFNGPNGFHNWGGNTPLGQLVDAFENADGTEFKWIDSPGFDPYANRDPRFYSTILYEGASWRQRPDDVSSIDPEGKVQVAYYEQEDGTWTPGLDTRDAPIEDWNGTYTGYYMRKFIDPAIDHQFEVQDYPWRQFRYAEILLNYAEACIELGEDQEARNYINMIRKRAAMPEIESSVSGNDLKEAYRHERHIELAYEQSRYFDVRRWMIAPDVMNQNAKGVEIRFHYGDPNPEFTHIEVQDRAWDNKMYFKPITLEELNRAGSLVQNPGY
ncbi:MAG: RagB/SusD family nutrient uptake outer membrane protein [Prolixibacteraceae bacterium]